MMIKTSAIFRKKRFGSNEHMKIDTYSVQNSMQQNYMSNRQNNENCSIHSFD